MEWKNAKIFIIVLLSVLNVTLLGLNYSRHQENTLTPNQEKAVFQVLSQNGISLYTDLQTKFSPMKKISLSIPVYSKDELKRMFFDGEDTTVTVENSEVEKIIIKSKTKVLTMKGNRGRLVFPSGTANHQKLDKNIAKQDAEKFMQSLGRKLGSFEFGNITKTEDGFVAEYFGKYKGDLVFANAYRITVTEKGITSADFPFFYPSGYTGEKKDICFSDEALFTFMKEYRKLEEKKPVTITKMELGYDFLEQEELAQDSVVKLLPCYRIYIMGQEKPYIINAYTNEMISN